MSFKRFINVRNRWAFFCAIFIAGFCCSIASEGYVPGYAVAMLSAVGAVVLLLLARAERIYLRVASLLLSALTFGSILGLTAQIVYFYPSQRLLSENEGKECNLVLRIDKTDSYGDSYASYNCSILSLNGDEPDSILGIYPSLRLNCFGGDFADKGDVVRLTAKITAPEKETADGFEEENYLKSRHIFISCDYSGELELVSCGEKGFFEGLRKGLSDNLTKYIGKSGVSDETLIARCMLLGDKSGVTSELKEIFGAAGVSHVLSVSGLHLSILFMTVSVLLGIGKRNPRRRFAFGEAVACALIFAYMALADFTPSIMRAGLMLIIMNVHSAFVFYIRKLGGYRDSGAFDSLSSLFVAGAIICVASPYSVFDVGMQLSFMSTLGILVSISVFDGMSERIKPLPLRIVAVSFCITFSAVSFTLPICMYSFGELSTMCAVSNLLITPLMMPLLVLLLLLAVLSLFGQIGVASALCTVLGFVCEKICGVCIAIAELNSSAPFSVLAVRESVVLTLVFALLVAIALYGAFDSRRRMTAIGYFAVICIYLVTMAASFVYSLVLYSETKVNFCTVKQVPYICFSVKNTRIIPDDGSSVRSLGTVQRAVGESLYDTNNVYLIVPTAESDYGTMYFNMTLLDEKIKIDTVVVPSADAVYDMGADMEAYSEFLEKLENHGFDTVYYRDGFSVDGLSVRADISPEASSITADGVCVVFSDGYIAEYAVKASENCERCIYFCKSASESGNNGYGGDAVLYVTSPHYKNVSGANRIPVRKPEILR